MLYLTIFKQIHPMDVLNTLPRDVSHMRQLLFDLPLPFSLSIANYKLFWPLIDNVYSIRNSKHVTNISGHYTRHYVICRFKRARTLDPTSSAMSRASTTKRSAKSCDVTFRLLEFDNHVEFHVSGDQSTSHDHLLDESDANKRN